MSNFLKEVGTLLGAIGYIAIVMALVVVLNRLWQKVTKSKTSKYYGCNLDDANDDSSLQSANSFELSSTHDFSGGSDSHFSSGDSSIDVGGGGLD